MEELARTRAPLVVEVPAVHRAIAQRAAPCQTFRSLPRGLHGQRSLRHRFLVAQGFPSVTLACPECLTASQSAPNGSYGPYGHIASMGNA